MAHHWPNENSKWRTLEGLLLHFGATWFSPSIEILYDRPIIVDCGTVGRKFLSQFGATQNSYQKPCTVKPIQHTNQASDSDEKVHREIILFSNTYRWLISHIICCFLLQRRSSNANCSNLLPLKSKIKIIMHSWLSSLLAYTEMYGNHHTISQRTRTCLTSSGFTLVTTKVFPFESFLYIHNGMSLIIMNSVELISTDLYTSVKHSYVLKANCFIIKWQACISEHIYLPMSVATWFLSVSPACLACCMHAVVKAAYKWLISHIICFFEFPAVVKVRWCQQLTICLSFLYKKYNNTLLVTTVTYLQCLIINITLKCKSMKYSTEYKTHLCMPAKFVPWWYY